MLHTGDFTAANKLCSSISFTSEHNRWRKEGYRMHHTSLGWRCLAAEAMNEAAPTHEHVSVKSKIRKRQTLPYPNVGMIKETQGRTHEFPYAHLLKQSEFAETGESRQDSRDNTLLNVCTGQYNASDERELLT